MTKGGVFFVDRKNVIFPNILIWKVTPKSKGLFLFESYLFLNVFIKD